MRSFVLCVCALSPSLALADGQFQTVNSRIYDPSGTEFLARGINVPGYNMWIGHNPTWEADLIADAWGFNLVRANTLPIYPGQTWGAFINNDALIKAFTTDRIAAGKKPVVVVLSPHESTGSYFTGQDLTDVTTWFTDLAAKYKDNPYVWFNVGNEPGNLDKPADWPVGQFWDIFQPDAPKWLDMHRTVISAIRATGNRNMILADGVTYGQDSPWDDLGTLNPAHSAALTLGKDIIDFDGQHHENILFDTHIYGMWTSPGSTPNRLEQYIQAAQAQNLPLIFGEYSATGAGTFTLANDMAALADQYHIGRAAWHWVESGDTFDLTTGVDTVDPGQSWSTGGGYLIDSTTNPTNLTPYGQWVWNDNRDLPASLRHLLPGDANDDGILNTDDFAALDHGFATHSVGWTNGDFNNDGTIDAADFLLLDTAYALQQGGTLSPALLALRQSQFGIAYTSALLASIPEPTSLAACGVALLPALTRRRHRFRTT